MEDHLLKIYKESSNELLKKSSNRHIYSSEKNFQPNSDLINNANFNQHLYNIKTLEAYVASTSNSLKDKIFLPPSGGKSIFDKMGNYYWTGLKEDEMKQWIKFLNNGDHNSKLWLREKMEAFKRILNEEIYKEIKIKLKNFIVSYLLD